MKFVFTFVLFCFSYASFSSGGDCHRSYHIKGYEPNFNLEYFGINSTLYYLDAKGKARSEEVVKNVGVYDIAKNEMNYVFKDTITRSIIDFHYETAYLEEQKTVEFDNVYLYNSNNTEGLYMFGNNINVAPRPVSKNIVLVTEELNTKVKTIWICDKYGNGLRKVFDINEEWKWEIDVKNQMVRVYRIVEGKVEVKNEKY